MKQNAGYWYKVKTYNIEEAFLYKTVGKYKNESENEFIKLNKGQQNVE